jgi:5S rRNA maturation endonuclease (ribonuclease M5)
LSTHLKDKEEKIQQVITKLAEQSARGNPIVVEGKKDEQTLRELGVEGKILLLKAGGKSYLDVVTEIEALGVGEIILLLDFDRRGKEATKHLQKSLEPLKIKANVRFWLDFEALVGREVQCIESLTSFLATLKQKIE